METILNNEQIETLTKTLEEVRSEDDKLLQEIEEKVEARDNSNDPLEEGEAIISDDGLVFDTALDDDDFDHLANLDANIEKLAEDNMKNTMTEQYNLSEEDAMNLILLINRVKKGEKLNPYDHLPKVMQEKLNETATENDIPLNERKQYLKFAAQLLIDECIHDMDMDAISIDFEKALKELVPTPTEMYSETNREYIENEFVSVAEKIKDTNPVQAKNLLDMRQGFIDAYKLDVLYKKLKDQSIIKSIRRCNKIWSRINKEYMDIASVCKFTLYSLKDLETSLKTIGYTEVQAKRLITLFVYTYTDGITDIKNTNQINEIYRNSFANYFENNIRNLAISPDLVSDFSKEIKQNINNLIINIDSIITSKEEELSNNKSNKKKVK